MLNSSLFTSKKEDWETPQKFFDELNKKYQFTYDLASSDENCKVDKHFTKEDDSLVQNWDDLSGWLWCNPPYGKNIKNWIKKASESKANIVMLIPARTDTSYWHDYIFGKAEIIFLRGRLKFEINGGSSNPAPFPSALVVFENRKECDINEQT